MSAVISVLARPVNLTQSATMKRQNFPHFAHDHSTFFSALMAAATSDMVATVQEHESRSATSLCGLSVFALPVATNALRISQAWHPRFDADPVHRFVRETVLRICRLKVQ